MEVEAFARTIFMGDASDYYVGQAQRDVSASRRAFGHGVAGGNGKFDMNFVEFAVSVLTGVEQGVAAGSVHDFIEAFCGIGIHTNTPFPVMYSFLHTQKRLCLNYSTFVLFCQDYRGCSSVLLTTTVFCSLSK